MQYTIDEHRHCFAAWAASRAASVIGCRFTVEAGKKILEAAGMKALICGTENLPEPENVDTVHREWRLKTVEAGCAHGFTHGVAAKLINVYFKSAYVCGGYHENERVCALHPPIDSLLLDELSEKDFGGFKETWNEARKIRWSKFSSEQYEKVIGAIRKALNGRPLWEIERYWKGYQ